MNHKRIARYIPKYNSDTYILGVITDHLIGLEAYYSSLTYHNTPIYKNEDSDVTGH